MAAKPAGRCINRGGGLAPRGHAYDDTGADGRACGEIGVPLDSRPCAITRLLCPRASEIETATSARNVSNGRHRGQPSCTGAIATRGRRPLLLPLCSTVHRWLKTWVEQVDVYVALTDFARRKFIQGGLPAEKIVLKPNFVDPDPGMREDSGDYALFVGRFAPEKKLLTLLEAWESVRDVPLKVVGSGLQENEIRQFAQKRGLHMVEFLGQRLRHEVFALMKTARLLVFPSEWYETFGLALVEAFACGVPVVAARLGAMAEIVQDGCTGLLFNPGDRNDLSAKITWAVAHPQEMKQMGRKGRQEFEGRYTSDGNRERLLDIYRLAIARASERRSHQQLLRSSQPPLVRAARDGSRPR